MYMFSYDLLINKFKVNVVFIKIVYNLEVNVVIFAKSIHKLMKSVGDVSDEEMIHN